MPSSPKIEHSRDILAAIREDSRRRFQRRLLAKLSKLCAAAMIVGLLNFILFLAGTFYLGGDAVNGKIEHGRYYVWGYSFREGTKGYSEVSKPAFDYSRWHAYTVMVTWPVMILAELLVTRIPPEK